MIIGVIVMIEKKTMLCASTVVGDDAHIVPVGQMLFVGSA